MVAQFLAAFAIQRNNRTPSRHIPVVGSDLVAGCPGLGKFY
jgi:hypothetical protein